MNNIKPTPTLVGDQNVVEAYANFVNFCMVGNMKRAITYWPPVQAVLSAEMERLSTDETLPVDRFAASLASDAAAVLQITTQGRKLDDEELDIIMKLSDFQQAVCTRQISKAIDDRIEASESGGKDSCDAK